MKLTNCINLDMLTGGIGMEEFNENNIKKSEDEITSTNESSNTFNQAIEQNKVVEPEVLQQSENTLSNNGGIYPQNNEKIIDVETNEEEHSAKIEFNSNSAQTNGASYYRETYVKNKPNNVTFTALFSALGGSIAGALIVSMILVLVVPAIDSPIKSYLSEKYGNATEDGTSYKKIEISSEGNSTSLVSAIAEKVSPSVVGIKTTSAPIQDFFSQASEGSEGEGSGIIMSKDGYIMTNWHVIEGAVNSTTKKIEDGAKIEVILPSKTDKSYKATVIGYDSKTDLAVIKISASNLPAAELGDSSKVKVGDVAVAIGNPGGLEYMGSVTSGVISGLNRSVDLDNGREIKLLQTDAAINPGNSGGALVNAKGQIIGINSVKLVATGFEGIGFAIPINTVKDITDSLIKNKYVKGRPFMGITVNNEYTSEIAKRNDLPEGVLVNDTVVMGAAFRSGIRQGDIITKFNGTRIKAYAELEAEKNKCKVGQTVKVELYRIPQGETKGNYMEVNLKLEEDKG